MNNNDSTNNPVPRVVKGTGFYTPMDLVPEATPQLDGTPQSPVVVGEMIGIPTAMDAAPTETTTQPPSAQPPQSGDGDNGQDG